MKQVIWSFLMVLFFSFVLRSNDEVIKDLRALFMTGHAYSKEEGSLKLVSDPCKMHAELTPKAQVAEGHGLKLAVDLAFPMVIDRGTYMYVEGYYGANSRIYKVILELYGPEMIEDAKDAKKEARARNITRRSRASTGLKNERSLEAAD
jgi:hypothetical protein